MVLTVDRGRYQLLTDDGVRVRAMKARELGKASIVVGDRVAVVGNLSGDQGTLARVVRVDERSTLLRRSADDSDAIERPIVANAEKLVIVTAVADPPARPGMIDRCMAAAHTAGMEAILCLTKTDLADPSHLERIYEVVGVPILRTSITGVSPHDDPDARIVQGVEAVREQLIGHTAVLIGHSGVGKSTLVNALVPKAERATGVVNEVTGRGRHTSSSAVALPLPGTPESASVGGVSGNHSQVRDLPEAPAPTGWVIDTPGVRSFGLAHLSPDELLAGFTELAVICSKCPRGCTHVGDSPDCELDTYIESDVPGARSRVESFRALLANRLADQEY